jgi:hypothetical protein
VRMRPVGHARPCEGLAEGGALRARAIEHGDVGEGEIGRSAVRRAAAVDGEEANCLTLTKAD